MKLWGGRFQKPTNKHVENFSSSLLFDRRLYREDIAGSIAHTKMLARCEIIGQDEADSITAGLSEIFREIESGEFNFNVGDEDIHMAIERALIDKIGPVGGKLHTARSRNDQVALDLRMYVKTALAKTAADVLELQQAIVALAEEHPDTMMPGYTHLQRAQPVLFAHHMMAYFYMTRRDFRRLADCYRETDILPLGSGAIAGTGFPIDRDFLAEQLGFAKVSQNSMDSVSDRDFVVQTLAALSLIMTHMSRLAEETIIWSTSEFGFITVDDAYATGSSMMPQKKNPDVAELVRGKCGRVYGHLLAMLTTLKGLPLTYNRDLQEDKEGLFDALDTVQDAIAVFSGMIKTLEINSEVMRGAAAGGFSTATDYADYLVKKGVAFRSAHEIIGRMVVECVASKRELSSLSIAELQGYSNQFAEDALELADVSVSVRSRKSKGGTSPQSVANQLLEAKKMMSEEKAWLDRHTG